jgi:hypothetical protein
MGMAIEIKNRCGLRSGMELKGLKRRNCQTEFVPHYGVLEKIL